MSQTIHIIANQYKVSFMDIQLSNIYIYIYIYIHHGYKELCLSL
jgi:hypothetical protein